MATTFSAATSEVVFTDSESEVVFTAAVSGPQGATGQGVPVGGTTGQALVKSSNADYATTWSTISGSGSGDVTGPASSVDGRAVVFDGTTGKVVRQAAAAPLLVGDAPTAHAATHAAAGSDPLTISGSQVTAGTVAYARLPVGTSSSTVAAGDDARFARPPALFASGQYTSASSASSGNAGPTNNRLYYQPIYVPRTITVDRFAVTHVATSAGAGSVMRLGIYNSTGDLPSTLLLDAGTVDLSTAANAFKTVTVSQVLTPGVYWLACVAQITSGSPTFATGVPAFMVPDGGNTFTGVKFEAGVTGTLPASATPGSSNTTQAPLVFVRIV
jgi:hypothetical protein